MNAVPAFPDESSSGQFVRQEDAFRKIVSHGGEFPPVDGRYHLYVSLACPWAHRTVIVRRLLKLDRKIGVTLLDPIRDERGWKFDDLSGGDPINGFHYLSEAYLASDRDFKGRYTVPVLWDKVSRQIVNNSEDDICLMMQEAFSTGGVPDLFPSDLKADQMRMNRRIYDAVNNGVYQAGFATKQAVYDDAVTKLFQMLDELDSHLADSRYLFGASPVETDWRLFCTLIRFDAVYHGHFKCNIRKISEYTSLYPYLRDLYQLDGIAETVDFDHIKRHYYMTHQEINPSGIVPMGPSLNLDEPHHRSRLCS